MNRNAEIDRVLPVLIDLRLALRASNDAAVRSRLQRIDRDLRRSLGAAIPKRRAARALGISVAALDKAIARGQIPVLSSSSTRQGVATTPLLRLAVEAKAIRETGQARAVLVDALRRVAGERSAATLPRANVTPSELRQSFRETDAVGRVLQASELSFAATVVAAAGRRGS